jgi:hypothetical protein
MEKSITLSSLIDIEKPKQQLFENSLGNLWEFLRISFLVWKDFLRKDILESSRFCFASKM